MIRSEVPDYGADNDLNCHDALRGARSTPFRPRPIPSAFAATSSTVVLYLLVHRTYGNTQYQIRTSACLSPSLASLRTCARPHLSWVLLLWLLPLPPPHPLLPPEQRHPTGTKVDPRPHAHPCFWAWVPLHLLSLSASLSSLLLSRPPPQFVSHWATSACHSERPPSTSSLR